MGEEEESARTLPFEARKEGKEGRRQGWERLPPPSSDGPSRTACRVTTMGGGRRGATGRCGLRVERG